LIPFSFVTSDLALPSAGRAVLLLLSAIAAGKIETIRKICRGQTAATYGKASQLLAQGGAADSRKRHVKGQLQFMEASLCLIRRRGPPLASAQLR
jgi:hypothetical protein